MVNKKGYFYTLELLLVVLVIAVALFYFPKSEQKHFNYEEEENLRAVGYGALYSLDEQGIFDKYFDLNITQSDFTKLNEYITNSITDSEIAKIEYIYTQYTPSPSLVCLNSTGQITTCGDVPKRKKEILISTFYTYFKGSDPITIKLYLRRYIL